MSPVALAAHERGDRMELHFMIFAILLLTLAASCAIRQAEEEMIEQNDLDRRARKPPLAQSNRETSDETEQGGDIVGYLRPSEPGTCRN